MSRPGNPASLLTQAQREIALEQLGAMRLLLAEPGSWFQGMAARDKDGNEVSPDDPYACSWCLMGASRKVGGDNWLDGAHARLWLYTILGHSDLAKFNDSPDTNHTVVLALLDRAIIAAGGQPPQDLGKKA